MKAEMRTLLEQFAVDVDFQTQELAKQVRRSLPEPLLGQLLQQDHQRLVQVIRNELETVVWQFLARFDNVGCSLPEGILGYTITAKTGDSRAACDMDIRVEEQDYCATWGDFVLTHRSRSPAEH